ncbi:DUF4363 family protein [Syntrophomonas curvata]
MKRKEYYAVIALLFAVFVFIMNGGDLFKKPLGSQDDFALYMDKVRENITTDEWEQAVSNNEKLSRAWKRIVPRIQFSVEKDEINAINVSLARLKGTIANRDPKPSLVELCEIREHWDNLNR